MHDTRTVEVPVDELLEAIAHVGALEEVLLSLEERHESDLQGRFQEVMTGLMSHVFEQPDDEHEYVTHPRNVQVESRSRELAGEILVQVADMGDIAAADLALRGAQLLGDAREIRDTRNMFPRSASQSGGRG
jgi:hypothetical protein